MILVVGLGNPGKKYEKTRHNIGFLVADGFQRKNNFPKFKFFKELSSLISEGKLNDKKINLAKPQTFMNLSGKGAKLLLTFYGMPIANLWVIHDDIDLPLGKIKIVRNRGAAGHKGVQSIIDNLGTKNFVRFRVGIKPKWTHGLVHGTTRFVLEKFTKDEEKILKEVISKTIKAIQLSLKEGVEKAMSLYNER